MQESDNKWVKEEKRPRREVGDGRVRRGARNAEKAQLAEAKRVRKTEVRERKREFGRKLSGEEMHEERLSALEAAGIKVERG
jgi:hypothetical protein